MLRVPGAIRIDRSAGWLASGAGHSDVRDDDLGARPAGEHIDRGAAAQEVLDHLRRHDLRVGAHPFGDDAVIAGQREDHRPAQPGWAAARDLGEAPRQLLEAPEAARGLGELIESVPRHPARRAPGGGPIRSRSFVRAVTALTPWRPGGRALDRNGDAGHHQRDEVGGGGDALVHRAEQVAEPEPDRGGRMDTLADLVGDDDERDAALAQDGGELVGGRQDGRVVTASVQEIGDPDA